MLVPYTKTEEMSNFISTMRDISGGVPVKHAWLFDRALKADNTPFPPEVLLATEFDTFYITPFVDGRLMIWDEAERRLSTGTRRPYIFLDSNMITGLREVMVDGSKEPHKLGAILHLIQHCQVWRAEAQPLPYLREIALRTTITQTGPDAKRAIEAMLRFQGVDTEATLAAESIVESRAFRPKLKEMFGSESYREAAEAIFADMAHKDNGLPGDMVSAYTTLLMMIDLALNPRKTPIEEKLKQADLFIRDVIIQAQPRLDVLARFFFGNKFGRLLKVAPGYAEFNRRELLGAVYDLNIAAIHEQFLGASTPPQADLTILCTADKALARFAPCFRIIGLGVFEDQSYRMLNDWDDARLKEILGEKLWQNASAAADKRNPTRMQQANDHGRIIEYMREFEERLKINPEDRLVRAGAEGNIAWLRTLDDFTSEKT